MSRQPSSLQLPHGQPLQPRGVVCHCCPVHPNPSSPDDISQRQPISLTPQQRPSHYFIIPPQTDRNRMPDSHFEFYCSSITSHRNPILDCSIQYTGLSTPPLISPRPSLSSANLGATANTPVKKM